MSIIYIVRILLACFLGGLIGIERESLHRPAGFRTHMLVCMGSALIMVTGEYVFRNFHHLTNMDPTRLGAQVVSGIGFLGAGTIIKEGGSVRGLTTAASLWAVSCVGLAVGAGFYWVAMAASAVIYIILVVLKYIEQFMSKRQPRTQLVLYFENKPGQIGKIGQVLGQLNVLILNIKLDSSEEGWTRSQWDLKLPSGLNKEVLSAELAQLEGVEEDLPQ
ncbi:MAG: MgtC/SapB family protein [Clostridia bacterium]